MSTSNTKVRQLMVDRNHEAHVADGDARRDDTLTRIRAALLQDKLVVTDLSGEDAGMDPYNSGTYRALNRAQAAGKRSR